MTKFKSLALHIIRIKYWKASGSGNPPSLIPVLRKIAIFGLKTKFYVLFCTGLYYSETDNTDSMDESSDSVDQSVENSDTEDMNVQ